MNGLTAAGAGIVSADLVDWVVSLVEDIFARCDTYALCCGGLRFPRRYCGCSLRKNEDRGQRGACAFMQVGWEEEAQHEEGECEWSRSYFRRS